MTITCAINYDYLFYWVRQLLLANESPR